VVTIGRGKKRERFEFGLGKHGGTWQEARIPLESFSRKSLELRFEVLTDDDLNLSAFLSEPQWIRETDDPVPHVLLITSDTHRGDHLGAVTDRADLATPILDQLAQEGTLFERCYTTTNVTLPSHAALFTGVHPRDTGILDNRTALAEEAPTLAEAYREAGYATWAAVSTRFLSDRISGLGQGFERYSETTVGQRPAAETIATLRDWLTAEPERPTFCWLHLFDAHSPYEPPEEYRTASLRDVSTERSTAAHLARGQALYRGEIHYLDAELAPLLELHESGWTAFTADHGEALGAHGIVFQHVELYPDTTHVPLILRGPGVPLGARISSFARHVDLGRTLLDLSGLADAPFPGSNLLTSASA
ncbi:MAG: sulfatase, partial [Planctomycetota bacterium]